MPDLIEKTPAPTRRARRTPEQQLADLHAQLATLRARAEAKKIAKVGASSAPAPVPVPVTSPKRRKFVRSRAVRPATEPASAPIPISRSSALTNSLDAQIQSCIESFSEDIVELIQRTTFDAIEKMLRELAIPGEGATDNGPKFGLAQSTQPIVPARSGRPMARGRLRGSRSSGSESTSVKSPTAASPTHPSLTFDHYERMAIERAIAESGGNVLAGADRIGLTRSAIYRRIKKLGIQTPTLGGTIAISDDDPIARAGEPVSLDAYEKAAILRALDECQGNIVAAAKLLNVGKSTLYRRMEVLGIPRHGGSSKLV